MSSPPPDDRITPHSLLSVAPGLVDSIALLLPNPSSVYAVKLLAGQCLEITLKAYLQSSGVEKGRLRSPDIRHDFAKLWSMAADKGLRSATMPVPHWVEALAGGHGRPYPIRYRPENSAVYVEPNNEEPSAKLRGLIHAVDVALEQTPRQGGGSFTLAGAGQSTTIGAAAGIDGSGTYTPP